MWVFHMSRTTEMLLELDPRVDPEPSGEVVVPVLSVVLGGHQCTERSSRLVAWNV